jgi:hypothetical protein
VLVILSIRADLRLQADRSTGEAFGGRSRRRVSVEGSDPVATIGHQGSASKGSF